MNSVSQEYDQLTQAHSEKMRDAIRSLKDQMSSRNCKFGEEIIPTFLKPVFLKKQEVESFQGVLDHISRILDKVTRIYFSHPELQDYFYLDDRSAKLMEIDHGYSRNVVITRPDSFLVDGALRFVEFNCDSPAGPGYTDITEEIFRQTFPLQQFSKKYLLFERKRIEHLLDALLSAYAEFAGEGKHPQIAIVDWNDVRTQNEFAILKAFFEEKGYATTIADPRDLKYCNGKLEHNGFPVDLVYRRVIFKELVEKLDEVQGFIEAYRAGAVCVVNPLRSRLASNKAILAIITNQRKFKELFTQEEQDVIKKHIPWTRCVLDMQTYYEGNPIFLRKHILTHKNSLVLKPADSYGGKGVVIGRECGQSDWDTLVGRILDAKEDWVVQKYVTITKMTVPVAQGEGIALATKKFNLNPFIFGGRYAGSMARLSDKSVINVSAGGGMVPVIEYKEKENDH